jgi:hypothetical protein
LVFIPAAMRLDLKDGTNQKVGELTIVVGSSLASTGDAVEHANQAAEQLGPDLAVLNNPIQAAAPLTAEITTQSNAWQPLLSRLGALVKVADTVAEARFILNCLGPSTTKKYIQTGSPLDQVSLGCRVSSL